MKRILLAAAITAVCILPTVAHAASTIVTGDWVGLSPDNVYTFPIIVSGNDQVEGVNLILQLGDGLSAPLITNIDLTGPGTIFHGNNTGRVEVIPLPGQQVWVGTTTNSGTVLANGILAFVTIDTHGVYGLFPYLLGIPEYEVQSDWADPRGIIVPQLVNGTVWVQPEPSSFAIALLAGGGLMLYAARRRRAQLAKMAG